MAGAAQESATTIDSLTREQALTLFTFYEEAAEKAKSHAWSQTTWNLTLNAAILAFAVDYFTDHSSRSEVLVIESISATVGVVLCGFLAYVLQELGTHIRHYWTTSNKIAATNAHLTPFISESDTISARSLGYQAAFPTFCRHL